jgi:pyruvate dehydrogenase E1 component
VERWNQLHPENEPRRCHVQKCLGSSSDAVIAVTDYVRAVPDLIQTWIPRRYITLGADGFGRSDTRETMRRFFEIDGASPSSFGYTLLWHESRSHGKKA